MITINPNVPLINFNTLRVGGVARWLAEPTNINDLKELISWANAKNISYQIIGAGSNVLINDNGLYGLTICMRKFHGTEINVKTGLIKVSAGEAIPNLAKRVAKAGIHGLEWAVGIPGTVGGAVVMNAGAQGGCIADWLNSATVINKKGEIYEIDNKQLKFDYRHSSLQNTEYIVLSAKFLLKPSQNPMMISKQTNQNLKSRITTQPYTFPSCGSVFRNPEPFKAAKLIEELGLKGKRIGGAEISRLHANFIVNRGNAKASDVKQLIEFIQKKVLEKHNLLLIPEVKELGFL